LGTNGRHTVTAALHSFLDLTFYFDLQNIKPLYGMTKTSAKQFLYNFPLQ
jgi:hypothetical protein